MEIIRLELPKYVHQCAHCKTLFSFTKEELRLIKSYGDGTEFYHGNCPSCKEAFTKAVL